MDERFKISKQLINKHQGLNFDLKKRGNHLHNGSVTEGHNKVPFLSEKDLNETH